MPLSRRGRLCFLLSVVLVVLVAPNVVFGWGFIRSRFSQISFSEVDVPAWVQGQFKSDSTTKSQDKEKVQKTTLLGPNDVGVETTIPGGAYTRGITVLDELYLRNGTLFMLTGDQSQFPSRADMVGEPVFKKDLDTAALDLQFLHPEDSSEILGHRAIRITGLSVIVTDTPLATSNFYSWWAEIVLGAWRIYSKLSAAETRYLPLPIPSRFILPGATDGQWRDESKLTGPLMRIGFRNAAVEQSDYWRDLAFSGTTVVFDRVILVSREATTRNSDVGFWSAMFDETRRSEVPKNFWDPIRQSVVRNTLGCLPDPRDVILGRVRVGGRTTKPLVTYISNQQSTPRLDEDGHETLIDALRALEQTNVCDFHVVEMERTSLEEQIEYVAKSTILVGAHGIGLTHQLWMPPSPKSTLLEIVWPNASYSYDHRAVAGILGHAYYSVWNDTLLAPPQGSNDKDADLVEDLDSAVMPVYAPAVAQLIRDRLSM